MESDALSAEKAERITEALKKLTVGKNEYGAVRGEGRAVTVCHLEKKKVSETSLSLRIDLDLDYETCSNKDAIKDTIQKMYDNPGMKASVTLSKGMQTKATINIAV